MDPTGILSALSQMSVAEIIILLIIVIVTAWLYLDPEKRTKFFLSNPSMAITIWAIAVLLSPEWYMFEIIRKFAVAFIAIPWLIMCTFAYGFRMYFYILNRMIEDAKMGRERAKPSWRDFVK